MSTLEYDRVTDVLRPFSGLDKIDPMILNKAAERGTWVHDVCDAWIRGVPFLDEENEWFSYVTKFQMWAEGKKFLPKVPRLYCDELMITGEIDGIYEENGKLYLFDIKTSSSRGKTWGAQGAAYYHLLREVGYEIEGIKFIQINRNKKPIIHDYSTDLGGFTSCLHCYRLYFKTKNGFNNLIIEDYI